MGSRRDALYNYLNEFMWRDNVDVIYLKSYLINSYFNIEMGAGCIAECV